MNAFLLALLAMAPADSAAPVLVRLYTARGTITVAVDSARAPRTAANFLRYVDSGDYDAGRFYRVVTPGNQPQSPVKIEVIQGGIDPARAITWEPIALERTSVTGLRHRDGTLSMARGGPDTATSEFFVCIGDQPELDFGGRRNPDGQGFAAFGRVVQGMDVVRAIQRLPEEGQRLTAPVTIDSARRVTGGGR